MATERALLSGSLPANCGIVELHIGELSQLFNSLDPSPFHEKDLDTDAEVYIVASARELPAKSPIALVMHLERPAELPDESRVVEEAIHVHFAREAQQLRWELGDLLRRGWVSLAIGLSFLAASMIGGQFVLRLLGASAFAIVLRESLLIGGWVAMWRPLEIFLYDWWPILGKRQFFDRLSRMPVRIVYAGTRREAVPAVMPD